MTISNFILSIKNSFVYLIFLLFSLYQVNAQPNNNFDIVIINGRVIDPETKLDAIRNIGVKDGRIVSITSESIKGNEVIDAENMVVAPGFIDLHVHGRDNKEQEYQVHDGVTTALELEWGIEFLDQWYTSRENKALINYGASVNWPFERFLTFGKMESQINALKEDANSGKLDITAVLNKLQPTFKETADEYQIEQTKENIKSSLAAGGIGIGIPIGYLPGALPEEVYRIYQFAAELDVPVFSHIREGGIIAVQQAISDAVLSGAALHIVHMNSMALGEIEAAIEMVNRAQSLGYPITTEVYPYTAASTAIESAIFDGDWQDRLAISYEDVQWVETGERLTSNNFERFRDKGGVVIIHMMKPEWIQFGIGAPNTIIASDGMPFSPLAHPRTAGTFSRVLGKYVREEKTLGLVEAIKKMTLLPAKVIEHVVPSMRFKGRIQIGTDADITIFDPLHIKDKATFTEGLAFSEGIHYVIVNGQIVIREKKTVQNVFPGKPVYGKYRR